MRKLLFSTIWVFVTTFTICCISCSSSKDENKESFKVGENAYFKDNCVGVADKGDWDEVLKYVKADDMIGISKLVSEGKAITFAAGKQVKVIETGFEFTQIRDLFASEALVYVPTNMLTHEDIYGVYQKE